MARYESHSIPAGRLTIAFTDRADGDFAVDRPRPELAARRQAIVPHPWTWLRQVHGDRIVVVTEPGQGAGTEADGAVTATPGCPLAVTTADCAPVVMIADSAFAVVHAGWRGLVAGIIARAADELGRLSSRPVATVVGPCISADAYEFGQHDLALAAAALGSDVRARTAWGTPALDVPRAVGRACEAAGWPPPAQGPACTSDRRWYSHRTRSEVERQVTVAWLSPPEGDR